MVPPASTPSETFIHELRNALNHLYDPDFLRASPLAVLFGINSRFDTPSALQSLLTGAIESLKPGLSAPNKAHAQSVYDLLLYRYVQQFNQDEIANQLGISVRHLRRQQNLAIYELARRLWEQRRLDGSPIVGAAGSDSGQDSSVSTGVDEISEELLWLKRPNHQAAASLEDAIEAAHVLIQPYAEQNKAHLNLPQSPEGLIQVHPVAFQQILLGLLTFAIKHAPRKEIYVSSHLRDDYLTVTFQAPAVEGYPPDEADGLALETVRKIVELSAGIYRCQRSESGYIFEVSFRAVSPVSVLVIDDNKDLITMLERFAAETRYRIIGLTNPNSVIEQALRSQPSLIVLDIMMPQVDGLQVLSRIKYHPALGHIPVIICSVLPQKDLATTLGAAGFVQKPVQREAFIAALDEAAA